MIKNVCYRNENHNDLLPAISDTVSMLALAAKDSLLLAALPKAPAALSFKG